MNTENKDYLFKKQYQKINLITSIFPTGLWHTVNYKFAYQKVIFTSSLRKEQLKSYWTKPEAVLCVTKMYFILNMVTKVWLILCDGNQLRMGGTAGGYAIKNIS